jgi:hypothetical protein
MVSVYMITIKISITFPYSSNEHSQNEIKKLFYNNIKYSGMNFALLEHWELEVIDKNS